MMPGFWESAAVVEYGTIEQVRLDTIGATMRGDHSAGAITLAVSDAGDFNAAGGEVAITSYPGGVETVNLYDYTSVDFENDTITLATGLLDAGEDGDWVGVTPLTVEKFAIVTLDVDGEAISARVPHTLHDRLVDGVREDDQREEVIVRLVDDAWVVTDVLGRSVAMRSPDWDEGEAGWEISDHAAQFPDLNVLNEFGAFRGSFDNLVLRDTDLATRLDEMAQGVIVVAKGSNLVNTAAVSNETIFFQLDFGPLREDRNYLVMVRATVTNSTDPSDVYAMQCRYIASTVAGQPAATPSLSSAVLPGSRIEFGPTHQGHKAQVNHFFLYSPVTDVEDMKVALTMERAQSTTGTVQLKNDESNTQFQLYVIDIGKPVDLITALSQKSKVSGSPDADPGSSYKKSWTANDSTSYDGQLWKRSGDRNTPDCYQGYEDGYHGNTRSLLAFDDVDIRNKLAGATIQKVQLKFRVKHAENKNGLDVRIRQHNHATLPNTYSSDAEVGSQGDCKPGSWYSVQLPNSVGTDLKNGTAKGLGFGPGATTHARFFGYIYGAGTGSAPVLTITYDK